MRSRKIPRSGECDSTYSWRTQCERPKKNGEGYASTNILRWRMRFGLKKNSFYIRNRSQKGIWEKPCIHENNPVAKNAILIKAFNADDRGKMEKVTLSRTFLGEEWVSVGWGRTMRRTRFIISKWERCLEKVMHSRTMLDGEHNSDWRISFEWQNWKGNNNE